MTYDPNIPAINTRIDQTYNYLTTNFTVLNTDFAKDHYEWNFGTVADQGLHRRTTLIQQAADPGAAATRGTIYTLNNPAVLPAAITRTDPYYRFDTGALGGSAIAPLLPFKAYATFDCLSAAQGADIPAANIYQAYNIGTIHRNNNLPGPLLSYTVTFARPLNNAASSPMDYIIFQGCNASDAFLGYANMLNVSFELTNQVMVTTKMSFGVISL
jgi:hypothetical protein